MVRTFTKIKLNLIGIIFLLSFNSALAQVITIDGSFADWSGVGTVIGTTGGVTLTAFDEAGILYLWVSGTDLAITNDTYINADCDSGTGYNGGTVWASTGQGGDILLQGAFYYTSPYTTGNGAAFTWNFGGGIGFNPNSYTAGEVTDIEYSFALSPGCDIIEIGGCFTDAGVELCIPEATPAPPAPSTSTYQPYTLLDPLPELPVEMTSFKGKAINDFSNQLYWSTSVEINNEYFEVQKSENGKDWIIEDKIMGNGTSSLTNHYQWSDGSPYKTSYYRLKQVDFSGESAYSSIIVIENIGKTGKMQVFPNPSFGEFTVYSEGLNTIEELKFYDHLGRDLSNAIQMNILSEESVNLDCSNLPSGLYYIKMNRDIQAIQVLRD